MLVYLAHLKTLDARLSVGRSSRQRLLSFWAPLATRGSGPLYAQLFLVPSVLNNDAVFDDALGSYLDQPGLLLKDHLPAVQGAIGMSAADLELLVANWGRPLDSLPLSLESISYLLRHAVLARGLKVSIKDLVAWKRLSGMEPFEPLAADPLALLDEDRPFTQILRFVDFVETVRAAGLNVGDAAYLMRHEFDPVGPHRDRPDVVIGLLRTLGSALERISAEHAIPPDPAAFSDDVLRQELALIATADVVDTFFGMWKRSAPAAGSAGADPVPQIGFDPAAAAAFLDRSFPGLFAAADIAIFDPSTSEADRRRRVAEVVLPYIQRRESRKEIARTLATQLGGDPALVESLLADIRLVKDPTVAGGGTPLVEAYLAAVGRGVTIRYFGSVDGSGPILQDPSVLSAPEFQSAPAQAKSARIEGFVEVPEGGLFHFWAKADGVAAEVALRFGGMSTPALLGKVATSGQEIQGQVQLKPGVLMPFTLDIHNLGTGCALSVEGPSLPRGSCDRLLLRPQGVFDRLERAQVLLSKVLGLTGSLGLSEREVRYIATYPDDFEGFAFATLPSVQASMPPTASAASGRQLLSLAEYVLCRRVLNVGSEEMASLLDGISRTVATSPNLDSLKEELLIDLCEALGQAMRRPPTAVRRLIEHFGFTVESTGAGAGVLLRAGRLAKPHALLRLLRGLEIAARIGVSADTLVGSGASAATTVKPAWAQPIPLPTVTPNPGPDIAKGIRDGVRALYDAETWRRVAQPISDKLRQLKRDALIAYIMHAGDFRSKEEMFQYFSSTPDGACRLHVPHPARDLVCPDLHPALLSNLESQPLAGQPTLAVPPSALDADIGYG